MCSLVRHAATLCAKKTLPTLLRDMRHFQFIALVLKGCCVQIEIDYKAECHSGDTIESLGSRILEDTNGTGIHRLVLPLSAQAL